MHNPFYFKHILNGANGTDGTNGMNGADGITPQIDVRVNPDGTVTIWYNVTSGYPASGWVNTGYDLTALTGAGPILAVIDNSADGTVTLVMNDGASTPFTFEKASTAIRFEIMTPAVEMLSNYNSTCEVKFRVNPSNAYIPTGSGAAIDKWELDEVATQVVTRSGYVTPPLLFFLISILPNTTGDGQYIATVTKPPSLFTDQVEHVMALVLNVNSAADPVLVSLSLFGIRRALPGSAAYPFTVSNLTQLLQVGTGTPAGWDLNAHYRQTANIDVSSIADWTPIGNDVNLFYGSYDGGGFTIDGLTIIGSGYYKGLFGSLAETALVKRVKLTNVNINATNQMVGGVSGVNYGTIESCSAEGVITGSWRPGGIVGRNYGTVRNCHSAVDVTGSFSSGIGLCLTGIIDKCYATGNIISGGGVSGFYNSDNAVVQNCVALNGSIQAAGTDGGRMVYDATTGSNILRNNYSRDDMTVIISSGTYTPVSDPDGPDGADVSTAVYNTQAFWEGLGYDFSATGPWVWDATLQLPVIR